MSPAPSFKTFAQERQKLMVAVADNQVLRLCFVTPGRLFQMNVVLLERGIIISNRFDFPHKSVQEELGEFIVCCG